MEAKRGVEKNCRMKTGLTQKQINLNFGRALALSLFCFISTLFNLQVYAQSANSSSIKIDKPSFDFGKVSQGTKVKHDFVVRNMGNAELKIDKLVSSCGCTASHASSNTIAPGAESKILVEFDSSGFSGEKVKTVQLYSNDPQRPIETLTLSGTIEPDVQVEPANIFFKEVIKGAAENTASQEVSVKIRPDVQAQIESFKSYSQYIIVKEISGDARQKRLLVSISPDAPMGELRERVVITLKGAKLANVNIPIFAVVRGNLRLSSNSLSFGILDSKLKDGLTRSVRLENSGPTPVKIEKIVSSDEAVKASYKTIKGGRIYVIQVEVDPLKVKNALRASVDIITDGAENLSLNVYGATPPPA